MRLRVAIAKCLYLQPQRFGLCRPRKRGRLGTHALRFSLGLTKRLHARQRRGRLNYSICAEYAAHPMFYSVLIQLYRKVHARDPPRKHNHIFHSIHRHRRLSHRIVPVKMHERTRNEHTCDCKRDLDTSGVPSIRSVEDI